MTNDVSFTIDDTDVKLNEIEKPFDPWAITKLEDTGKRWGDKTTQERVHSILLVGLRVVLLFAMLYLFICSLDLLSNSFRLLGGKAAGNAFSTNWLVSNPFACLMAGIVVTVVVQSSSTCVSIAVSMVAAGLLHVQPAIYIVMGSNIGTSVTNTLVAMGHVVHRDEFRRAFAGGTVHDMFNWLSALCLLPVEWFCSSVISSTNCGFLCTTTGAMVKHLKTDDDTPQSGHAFFDFLKAIKSPFTNLFIQVDSTLISSIASKGSELSEDFSLLKRYCGLELPVVDKDTRSCYYLFEYAAVVSRWKDSTIGICLLLIALVFLCGCLAGIVKLLHLLMKGKMAEVLKRICNANFPKPYGFLTGYVAILVGACITVVLQSSSIFTSALTPLVGIGLIHIKRMYPLTLGANIGTTFTALMAAMSSSRDRLPVALQVALCHLFFNIFGIAIWYPIPAMRRVPIRFAQCVGNITADYRWFAVVYLLLVYLTFPVFVFVLSMGGVPVLLGVGVPIVLFIISLLVINALQTGKPSVLPFVLRTWDFLPIYLRSIQPYDAFFSSIFSCCVRRNADSALKCCSSSEATDVSTNLACEEILRNGRSLNSVESSPTTETTGICSVASSVPEIQSAVSREHVMSYDLDVDVHEDNNDCVHVIHNSDALFRNQCSDGIDVIHYSNTPHSL